MSRQRVTRRSASPMLARAPLAWPILLAVVGIGGTIMAAALVTYVFGLARSALPRARGSATIDPPGVNLTGVPLDTTRTWTGPVSILILVGAMAPFTVLAFELMNALPLAASGGGAH